MTTTETETCTRRAILAQHLGEQAVVVDLSRLIVHLADQHRCAPDGRVSREVLAELHRIAHEAGVYTHPMPDHERRKQPPSATHQHLLSLAGTGSRVLRAHLENDHDRLPHADADLVALYEMHEAAHEPED